MANDKNIKIFSAADIEKYHKGLLSAKEMHNLEKAALDDPFLADALEGYAMTGLNINEDIIELKNRLANRTGENKVVPIVTQVKSSSFQWWKIAAMFLLIAGAGWIVYQIGFNNKLNEIAQAGQKETAKSEEEDSVDASSPSFLRTDSNSSLIESDQQEKNKIKSDNDKTSSAVPDKKNLPEKSSEFKAKIKDTETQDFASKATNEPSIAPGEKTKQETLSDNIAQNKINTAKEEELKARNISAGTQPAAPADKQKRNIAAQELPAENNYKSRQGAALNQTNIFRGRVTDANNNALPFSNITNIEDHIGTYSDARGYFTLTSPDSVLKVQVSSLGFESNQVQLLNTIPSNKVLLKEDRSSLSEIVISNKKSNSYRARNNTMMLEEPEPADGWSNYDIYLANNLKIPESLKDKQTGTSGEVYLSFDVTKEGLPVNIKVKKSLCESCDKEAIRLIREGPKWKRKTKKGKATVTVSF